jgi:integrase
MVDGQRLHRVVGKESENVTRSQCEELIAKLRTDAREGRLQLPTGRKTHLTFSQAAYDYLARLEQGGGKNMKAKRRHLKRTLKPFFASQRLNTISDFTVGRYRKSRAEVGAATATINRELATLSHLLNRAVEWKWIPAVPCKVRKEKEGRGRVVVLDDTEADALLKAAVADQDSYLWLFVLFGLNTGMRHSEILRTRFDQIDFARLRLYIPEAKAGQREQPITPQLADVLRRERDMREDRDGWIFPAVRPDLSGGGHRTRMDRPFQRAVKRAGLDPSKVTPHVLRHTAITNLVQAGIDLPTIQRISGHKTLAMVMRYSHIHGGHIDRAVKAIGRGLPKVPEAKNPDTITPRLHSQVTSQRNFRMCVPSNDLKNKAV